jgi:hypothetical protein
MNINLPHTISDNPASRRAFFRRAGATLSASALLSAHARVARAADSISGKAIVERRGQGWIPVTITSVRDGKVAARREGVMAPMKFSLGEVTKIFLDQSEAVPGIGDHLRIKYVYDKSKREFVRARQAQEVEISSWDLQQDKKILNHTTTVRGFAGDTYLQKQENHEVEVFGGEATASARVKNLASVQRTLTMTLQLNDSAMFAHGAQVLGPLEETIVSIKFATGGREIAAARLFDYEIA